jgi:hypothetical protein
MICWHVVARIFRPICLIGACFGNELLSIFHERALTIVINTKGICRTLRGVTLNSNKCGEPVPLRSRAGPKLRQRKEIGEWRVPMVKRAFAVLPAVSSRQAVVAVRATSTVLARPSSQLGDRARLAVTDLLTSEPVAGDSANRIDLAANPFACPVPLAHVHAVNGSICPKRTVTSWRGKSSRHSGRTAVAASRSRRWRRSQPSLRFIPLIQTCA